MIKRNDIQGLRALAVIAVMLYHADLPVIGGYAGVDIFFVISGFVISKILISEVQINGRIYLWKFYSRRFKRLAPALSAVIFFTALTSIFLASPVIVQESIALTGISAQFLTANLVISASSGGYFDSSSSLNALLNTWSLSVEEQFYIFFPILIAGLVVGHRISLRLKLCLAILASISLAICVSREFLGPILQNQTLFGFYSLIPRVWEFATGSFAAIYGEKILRKLNQKNLTLDVISVISFATLVASLLLLNQSQSWPNYLTLVPVLATASFITFSRGRSYWLGKQLERPTVLKIGDASYSLYLWHFPLIALFVNCFRNLPMNALIGCLLSVLPALLCHKFVENRFRYIQIDGAKKWFKLISSATLIPLTMSTILLFGARDGWGNPNVREFQRVLSEKSLDVRSGCSTSKPLDGSSECVFGLASSKSNVYLLGDSIAGAYSDGISRWATNAGVKLHVRTAPSCPSVNIEIIDKGLGFRNEECSNFLRQSLGYLSHQQPGLVILSESDWYWLSDDYGIRLPSGEVTFVQKYKIPYLKAKLKAFVTTIVSYGHRVLFLESPPQWRGRNQWQPEFCTLSQISNFDCSKNMHLDSYLESKVSVTLASKQAVEEAHGLYIEVSKEICKRNICSTSKNGNQIYRDRAHITVRASYGLQSFFETLFR